MDVARSYLEHLTEYDVELLVTHVPGAPSMAKLKSEPEQLLKLLERREAVQVVFRRDYNLDFRRDPEGVDVFATASPFLVFALAIQAVASELESSSFVAEWIGPRQRVPVFDAHVLAGFLAPSERRFYLATLLDSYTHVYSGSVWVHAGARWRRRRFSELDPFTLVSLLESVPEPERAGIYRRLGDLALFLTGVFPDYTATRLLGRIDGERLSRMSKVAPVQGASSSAPYGQSNSGEERTETTQEISGSNPVALLARLGKSWYERAVDTALFSTDALNLVADIARHFEQARRVLNIVTDRYLFDYRAKWLPEG